MSQVTRLLTVTSHTHEYDDQSIPIYSTLTKENGLRHTNYTIAPRPESNAHPAD